MREKKLYCTDELDLCLAQIAHGGSVSETIERLLWSHREIKAAAVELGVIRADRRKRGERGKDKSPRKKVAIECPPQ